MSWLKDRMVALMPPQREVCIVPSLKMATVTVNFDRMQQLERCEQAWKRVCGVPDSPATTCELIMTVRECRTLYGDPNAPTPQGSLEAR